MPVCKKQAEHQQRDRSLSFRGEGGGGDDKKRHPAHGLADDTDGATPSNRFDERDCWHLKQLSEEWNRRKQSDDEVAAAHLKRKGHQEGPRRERAHGLGGDPILEHPHETGFHLLLGERFVDRKTPVDASLQPPDASLEPLKDSRLPSVP
jgi:hypothetical protein